MNKALSMLNICHDINIVSDYQYYCPSAHHELQCYFSIYIPVRKILYFSHCLPTVCLPNK